MTQPQQQTLAGNAADVVRRPLDAVAGLFQLAGCPTTITSSAGQPQGSNDFGVQAFFELACGDLSQVPRLDFANAATLPNRSLVRLQGMVQDLPNPEVYLGVARLADGSLVTTKYSDGLMDAAQYTPEPQGQYNQAGQGQYNQAGQGQYQQFEQAALWDRRPMVLTRPPLSPWVEQQHRTARQQQQQQQQGMNPAPAAAAGGNSGSQAEAAPAPVVVYLYDRQGADLMLHDLVEVVGVLSREDAGQEEQVEHLNQQLTHKCNINAGSGSGARPHACAGGAAGLVDADFDMEDEQAHFLKMTRVHAILVAKQPSPVPAGPAPPATFAPATVVPLRQQALQLLTSALGGDALAAEYVLMLALQRVTGRSGDMSPMGITPLNITHCPTASPAPTAATTAQPSFAQPAPAQPAPAQPGSPQPLSPFGSSLLAALSALLPMTQGLPLSVGACNDPEGGPWAPRQSSEGAGGRVSRSALQVPPGTLLVVDETVLREGRLESGGVANLQALARLAKDQVLEYDFEVYKHPVPVSAPTLVVSTGRSMLRDAMHVQVPLHATAAPAAAFPSLHAISELVAGAEAAGQLDPVRAYLAAAGQLPYELGEGAKQLLVEEFVRRRQQDAGFGAEQFQAQLTLARACALSFGEVELSPARWEHLQQLEAKRQERLRVV